MDISFLSLFGSLDRNFWGDGEFDEEMSEGYIYICWDKYTPTSSNDRDC